MLLFPHEKKTPLCLSLGISEGVNGSVAGLTSSSRCQVVTVLFSHFLRGASCLVKDNLVCYLTNTQFSDSIHRVQHFPLFLLQLEFPSDDVSLQ